MPMLLSLQEWMHRSADHRHEFCIIGSGALGIDLAVQLARAGRRVLVLEGGGRDLDPRAQKLQQVRESGRPFRATGGEGASIDDRSTTQAARVRVLGGATKIWEGTWKQPDPVDFEPRPWLGKTAWPLRWSQLEGFAGTVMRDYGVPLRAMRVPPVESARSGIRTTLHFEQKPPVDFAHKHAGLIESAGNLTVVLDANVVELLPAPGGSRVSEVTVKGFGGVSTRVVSEVFVLAVGGIETARLLLLSSRFGRSGPGNAHGHVGAGFMEHPRARLGVYQPDRAAESSGLLGRAGLERRGVHIRWTLPPGRLQALAIGNHAVALHSSAPRAGWPARWFRRPPAHEMTLLVEQLAHAGSRITLDPERDELGTPIPRVHWELSPGDEVGLRKFVTAIIELVMPRFGRIEIDEAALFPKGWTASGHHMGTARMAAAAHEGVVDPDCRVFGVDNLFVAGSAVFPVSGNADPMLLALALGRRLAKQLAR